MKTRKQTALWTTKAGDKIRICDMSDSHLKNTITMLENYVARLKLEMPYPCFQGDMAQFYAEDEYDNLMQAEPEDLLPPIYEKLVAEQQRRNES